MPELEQAIRQSLCYVEKTPHAVEFKATSERALKVNKRLQSWSLPADQASGSGSGTVGDGKRTKRQLERPR